MTDRIKPAPIICVPNVPQTRAALVLGDDLLETRIIVRRGTEQAERVVIHHRGDWS